MKEKVRTGISCIDGFLEGGLAPETITMVYGEPETGKTTFGIQCAVNCALQGFKTLYVDCDHTFSTERLSQISQESFAHVSEQILLIRPKNFAEQTALIDRLPNYFSKSFGLVVIDTFNSLYRAQVAEVSAKASFGLNRELNRQMALVAQTAKTEQIPILVTSQVKSLINEPYVSVAPVANRVLEFWADITIALKLALNMQVLEGKIKKNRNPQEATCYLRITQTGIHDCQ